MAILQDSINILIKFLGFFKSFWTWFFTYSFTIDISVLHDLGWINFESFDLSLSALFSVSLLGVLLLAWIWHLFI